MLDILESTIKTYHWLYKSTGNLMYMRLRNEAAKEYRELLRASQDTMKRAA